MKQLYSLILAILIVGLFPHLSRADLESDIGAVLRDRLLAKASVGIRILAVDASGQSRVLYEHNPGMRLIPASNMKILTTSAALDALGQDFKFRTLLLQRGNDLILLGDGDPTFGDAELLKRAGWKSTTVFSNWAELLKKRGLTQIDNLIVDDSVFDETFAHPHWPVEQLHNRFSAEVAGMTMNAGAIDIYVQPTAPGRPVGYRYDPPAGDYLNIQNTCISGRKNSIVLDRRRNTNQVILTGGATIANIEPASVSVHDPALFAAHAFAQVLSENGIKVGGGVVRDRTIRPTLVARDSGDFALLAVHETVLSAVVSRTNKDSMNMYAESLCKRLGYATTGESGSWKNGPAAVAAFIRKCGVDDAQLLLDDGCGLSHQNRVSVAALSQVLEYDFHSAYRDVFMASLPIAGIDGTLKERFDSGPSARLRGRVMAKTGYVVGASALSGYLKGQDDKYYVFSILMNDLPRGTNSRAKELQESIVLALDQSLPRAEH